MLRLLTTTPKPEVQPVEVAAAMVAASPLELVKSTVPPITVAQEIASVVPESVIRLLVVFNADPALVMVGPSDVAPVPPSATGTGKEGIAPAAPGLLIPLPMLCASAGDASKASNGMRYFNFIGFAMPEIRGRWSQRRRIFSAG